MLRFLSNDRNDGNARDAEGNRVPPNENYAREFLQLFSMGPVALAADGAPTAAPNYAEDDVREGARARTGWVVPRTGTRAKFSPALHDAGDKTIFGAAVAGRRGADGRREVDDVVDLVMRHPSTATFVARSLVWKFATETPPPGYVERVAAVFRSTDGDLRETMRALLLDPVFTSPEVVRTQVKTPVEHVVGGFRALGSVDATGSRVRIGSAFCGEPIYYPPTVFSFYPPGDKAALVTTRFALNRDRVSADTAFGLVRNQDPTGGTGFDAVGFAERNGADTAERLADVLADKLLAAPLSPAVRERVVAYVGAEVTGTKVSGAAWLVMCSPDYQVN
jgi:uncharacterized protein (DUF1800 family)